MEVEGQDEGLDAYAMDRYSRQIGAYGVEAMGKLIKLKVLVIGLRGVGVEVAKNLLLAGPAAVTLVDDTPATLRDLGSNFFLSEEDVGKSRAACCAPKLQELNRLVRVSVHSGALTEELVAAHTVVVATALPRAEAVRWNAFCRSQSPPVGYVQSAVHGAMGYAFVDFGPGFMVRDLNGEQPVTRIVQTVSNAPEAVVSVLPPPDGKRHNVEESAHDGWVQLSELEGAMACLNGQGPFRARHCYKEVADKKTGKTRKVFDAYSLRLEGCDTSALGPYEAGGQMAQVKLPVERVFRSLQENVAQPVNKGGGEYSLLFTDGAKFGRAEQLHAALRGLWQFEAKNGRLPAPNVAADAEAVAAEAVAANAAASPTSSSTSSSGSSSAAATMMEVEGAAAAEEAPLYLEELDSQIALRVGRHAACELQPLCAFFGGVVAQEVVKHTGKFTPLNQWLHLDAFEVLPDVFPGEHGKVDVNTAPIGSRHDDHIAMLGQDLQSRLGEMRTFMVGCGALGCEFLKNFALIGLGCGEGGEVVVTDNDRIEVSNLSRQFLFREHNVGHAKSVAACAAAVEMNAKLNVRALEMLVAPHTEGTFNDGFWERQDFVTNALDNVKARMYVDGQCVFYGKPLLESGTLGTKCNVQVVLPNMTASYADGPKDTGDAGDAIPMCTLRNFPSQIEHCIEWARAQFTDLFTTTATEASNFALAPRKWLDDLRAKTLAVEHEGKRASAISMELAPLRAVGELLQRAVRLEAQGGGAEAKDAGFKECVELAWGLFHRLFRDRIASLVSQYPEDAKDKEGRPFWAGTKRFPSVACFDPSDEWHLAYVTSVANLFAVNMGLRKSDDPVPMEGHGWRSGASLSSLTAALAVPAAVVETVDMSGQANEDEEEADEEKEAKGMDARMAADLAEFTALFAALEAIASDQGPVLKQLAEKMEPADFEKDQDWNFHIDFIAAATNIRAANYRLAQVGKHKCKMIAGKIIPAIATTTASVTGLICLELIKLAQGKAIEAYKDSSNSLGINGYFFSEPVPPVKMKDEYDPIEMAEVKCRPSGYTKWDKTAVRAGDCTLREFLAKFTEQTGGLRCTQLLHKSADEKDAPGYGKFIYERDCWKPADTELYEKRLDMNLKALVLEVYGEDVVSAERKYVMLDSSTDDEEENAWKVPAIVFHFGA